MRELNELKEQLNKITSYPDSLKAVCCEITGVGFFPGARGLYKANDDNLSDKSIMILGHDFGADRDYINSVKRGNENLQGLTWKNLLEMLALYDINPKDCFFTNAIMGVRTEASAVGKSPGFEDKIFLADCKKLLIEQINMVKPKLIIALGQHVWSFLADISPNLKGLESIKTFSELDNSVFNRVENISFKGIDDYNTDIAFITHPTYWPLNVKNRKYNGLNGVDAESEMIRSLRTNDKIFNCKTKIDMNIGDYVVYKIEPTKQELEGEIDLDQNSHGRLFLSSTFEIETKVITFKDKDSGTITGIFSLDKYYVLSYDNK